VESSGQWLGTGIVDQAKPKGNAKSRIEIMPRVEALLLARRGRPEFRFPGRRAGFAGRHPPARKNPLDVYGVLWFAVHRVLPFRVPFKTGAHTYEQVVYAAKKAIISGALKPGDGFPSVRVLSQELRINPNTAQKAVAALAEEGLLTIKPGIGTVIADTPPATQEQRKDLLGDEVERIVVEARKLHLGCDDLVHAVKKHWNRLQGEP
jgi:GntR family transcriptional regulator